MLLVGLVVEEEEEVVVEVVVVVVVVVVVIVLIVICYMALKYSESLPLTFHAFSAKVNANVQFQTRIYQNHNISSWLLRIVWYCV